MNIQIPLLSSLIYYFKIFYTYAGNRIIILLSTVFSAGILEGLGISIVIPLLSYENNRDTGNQYTKIVYGFLENIGLGVSISSILILMVILFLFKGFFMTLISIISSRIKTKLEKDLRSDFCLKYANVKYSYFIKKPIGYFNNIISTEINATISGLNNYINVITTVTYIIIYVAGAFLINSNLTIIVIAFSIILFFLLRRLPRLLKKISILLTQTRSETQSLIIQKLYNYKYLKATSSFSPILEQINNRIEKNRKYQFRSDVYNEIMYPLMEVIAIIALSLLVWYYIDFKHREISEILVLLVFFWRALGRILSLQNAWQRFSTYIGSVQVITKEKNELDKNTELHGAIEVKTLKKGIELKNVIFSYGSQKILSDINIIIPKNKSIGIVGHSGAGKTTLFDTIVGLITVQSGSILIDDIEYKETKIDDLRRMIGYVTQEPITFNDTIANNISLWSCKDNEKKCMAEIRKAADLANCTDFIKHCEDGFNTVIGDKGVKLSGGQRQRIAIAREIFKDPKIMIFDEATSSLDTESEQYIQKSIDSMMGKCTIIIIAHRLSTIKNCDYIYVLSKGRIVEEGKFDELYTIKNGLFRKMCLAQQI